MAQGSAQRCSNLDSVLSLRLFHFSLKFSSTVFIKGIVCKTTVRPRTEEVLRKSQPSPLPGVPAGLRFGSPSLCPLQAGSRANSFLTSFLTLLGPVLQVFRLGFQVGHNLPGP